MTFGRKRARTEPNPSTLEEDQDISWDLGDDHGTQDSNDSVPTNLLEQQVSLNALTKPLSTEVTYFEGALGKNPGGSKRWKCNHCEGEYLSSYTRIHYHFFGAPAGIAPGIKRCPKLMANREEYKRVMQMVLQAEKKGIVASSLKSSTLFKHDAPPTKNPIKDAFKVVDRDTVDMAIMKGLCANGIPFNVLRNPEFCEMIRVINEGPKGYKPPSYEKARTTLLDECKRNVEKSLAPVKDTWHTHGISIVSDGWTNVKHEPLINVIATNSEGAMFLYADSFSGVHKTGHEIAKYLLKAIDEVGPEIVLQVVTDNAANCKSAGKEIEKVHKHIFWSPCVVHTLNLMFKDIAKELEWFTEIYKLGKSIVKYFLNHEHALAFFRSHTKLELLKVAKTRFASHYILLKRLLDCREALATTVVLQKWKDWLKSVDEQTRIQGVTIANLVSSDEFWKKVQDIVSITKPIYYLIKFADGEGQKMGEIYERKDNMLGEVKDVMTRGEYFDQFDHVENIILARWEKMNIPIHCLGFALTPKFYDREYLSQLAPGGTTRKAPNQDSEVIKGVMDAFRKIADSEEEAHALREQFDHFHQRKGLFSETAVKTDAVTMDSISWWSTYGSKTPNLAEVAKNVLAQPITSSSAERNWSTYSYIHSIKRNRLNSARADKLVFIYSNIRLLSRFTASYKQGPYKKWDVDPEATHIDVSAVRLEEMRWTSLENEYVSEEDSEATISRTSTTPTPLFSRTPTPRPGTRQTHISSFGRGSSSSSRGNN